MESKLSFLASDASTANNPKLESWPWHMVDLRTFFIRARVINDRSADATDTGIVQNILNITQTLRNRPLRRNRYSVFSKSKGRKMLEEMFAEWIVFKFCISSTSCIDTSRLYFLQRAKACFSVVSSSLVRYFHSTQKVSFRFSIALYRLCILPITQSIKA